MNYLILLLSAILITGISVPVYAQTISDNIVINEIDTNPNGDDSLSISEWVELYNPTDSDVDLSGWQIASTTVLKKTFTIPDGTIISPDNFLIFTHAKIWFTDSGELVELRNANGIVVDKTPSITDLENNFLSWQRSYDSYPDWEFTLGSPGGSNGKFLLPDESSLVTIDVSSDKTSYLFDDTAIIQGTVSEKMYVEKPYFQTEPILITISGPNFDQALSLYPDNNLNYKTTLDLVQVLGINEGVYDVSVSYAGTNANTSFSVNSTILEKENESLKTFNIHTEELEYLPGQSVLITAFSSEIVPFESMDFSIINPKGEKIDGGNLFSVDGKFNTTVMLSPTNPVYGTYNVIAEYSEQNDSVSFNLVESLSDDVSNDVISNNVILNPLTFTISVSEFADNDCRNCVNVVELNMSKVLHNQFLTFSGLIPNYVGNDGLTHPSAYYNLVQFSFKTSDGKPVTFTGHTNQQKGDVFGDTLVPFTTTAIPDKFGNFITNIQISPVLFLEGNYVVEAKYGPNIKSKLFSVVSETSPNTNLKTIIEKVNRIPDNLISIDTEEKMIDNQFVKPRVLSGSMIVVDKDSESDVNLRVVSESGICIIGSDVDCLVTESTRKPGKIFDVVQVDGLDLNVRYSGSDVRLEKFSILPTSSDDFLPDTNWNVEVIKGNEVSRLYYKVTYKTLQ
jgi:hypothetical protein